VATGPRVEEVASFAVIHGPPGAGYQLTKDPDEVIRVFLRATGGNFGVCAGNNESGQAKLLPMTADSLKNQDFVSVGVRPHTVT